MQIQIDKLSFNEKCELYESLRNDKDFLHAYSRCFMAACDTTTAVNTAIRKSEMNVAANLLHDGMTLDFIQRHTGLDVERIKSLS